jgi:hypothetical protein
MLVLNFIERTKFIRIPDGWTDKIEMYIRKKFSTCLIRDTEPDFFKIFCSRDYIYVDEEGGWAKLI